MSKKVVNGRIRTGVHRPVDKLPTVTSDIPRDLRLFIDRVRDAVNGRGDDQLVTTGDLKTLGVVDGQLNPVGGTPEDYLPVPSVITGLTAQGGYQNVTVSWDLPSYLGHAYTELWASPVYDTSIAPGEPGYVDPSTYNDLALAQPIMITTGAYFVDRLGNSKGRYYWARNINTQDRAGPFNAVGGTAAETAVDVEYLLDTLQGAISEGQLATALTTRLDGIESNGAAIQAEATTRANETGALFAQYTVKIDVNGYVAGFGLASTPVDGGGQESEFAVLADRFYIASPVLGVANAPFIVQATPTTINGVSVPAGVYMDAAYIRNGTITNAKIGNAAIDNAKIANLSAAKITTGTLDADRIAAASITTDKLTVRGGQSNVTPNGTPFSNEFDGWSNVDPGITITTQASASGFPARQNAPTAFIYQYFENTQQSATIVEDVYIRTAEQFAISFEYAGGDAGSGIDLTFTLEVVWGDPANATVRTDLVPVNCTSALWTTRTAKLVAPTAATRIKTIKMKVSSALDTYGFFTNISVKRALNDVLIEDGAITAGKLAINASLVDLTPNGTPTSYFFDGWSETDPGNSFLLDDHLSQYDYYSIRNFPSLHIVKRDVNSPSFAEVNAPTDYVYRFAGNGLIEAVIARDIYVSEGDKVYVAFDMAAGGSSVNTTIEVVYEWGDPAGAVIGTSVVTGQRFGNGWLPFSGTIVAPAGTTRVNRIIVRRPAGGNTVFTYFTNLRSRRVISGVLIEDGAVTADKLSATAIDGKVITGALIRTAVTGSRVEVQDDGTYLVWGGDGTKNDTNATFYIKKNGDARFNGKVRVEQIIGQSIGGAVTDINHLMPSPVNGTTKRILNLTVAPSPLNRRVIIPPLEIYVRKSMTSGGAGSANLRLKINGVDAVVDTGFYSEVFYDTNGGRWIYLPYVTSLMGGFIPAGTTNVTVELWLESNETHQSIGVSTNNAVILLAAESNEVTINTP